MRHLDLSLPRGELASNPPHHNIGGKIYIGTWYIVGGWLYIKRADRLVVRVQMLQNQQMYLPL